MPAAPLRSIPAFHLAAPRGLLVLLIALLAAAAACAPRLAHAQSLANAQNPARPNNIAAQLLAEGPAAPGSTVTLAIRMRPAEGWHGYWQNPGDAGLGMSLKWALPPGFSADQPRYPVPGTLLISGLMNHVFKHEYALLVPLAIPADARPGDRATIALDAEWLACTDQLCVPERGRLTALVTIAARGTATPPDPQFDTWRARLPAPLGARAVSAVEGNSLRLAIPMPRDLKLADPHVFAVTDRQIAYAAPQEFRRLGDSLIVSLQRADNAAAGEFQGVLRLDKEGSGVAFSAQPGTVPQGGELLTPAGGPGVSLGWLVLAALAGGLLLNIMPCVFPILSLKALSLVRAGESAAAARKEGLAYAAGTIVAALALGGTMLALRAAGTEVGWAFQLQEPAVVIGLFLLALGIAANLAGLYEFVLPLQAGSKHAATSRNAFATGLLAAFVATPCTGPFMATAMGAALLLPPLPALALFGALGLGLALPFVAIAWVPPLRRALPRPGGWMLTFRKVLAVPMALTAAALGWLAWRIGGLPMLAGAGAAGAAILILLALIGRRQRRGVSASMLGAGVLIMAAAAMAGLAFLPATKAEQGAGDAAFSEQALERARAEGRPVFAYFTADWCLTCKVNESVAIDRPETRAAFARAGVLVLRGDWTRRDPAITRYLEQHGAAGVPLYVWYPAEGGAPRTMPQLLTPQTLIVAATQQ